jgi:hypothetical protein
VLVRVDHVASLKCARNNDGAGNVIDTHLTLVVDQIIVRLVGATRRILPL